MPDDPEIHAKRKTAVYADTINRLRIGSDLSDAEMDRLGIEANEHAVWGHDAKKDRNGNYIQQGLGSPGHESANHYAAILRYCGRPAWEEAVREIQKRDPERHAKLGLPKLT
jgi:hypothetical protein